MAGDGLELKKRIGERVRARRNELGLSVRLLSEHAEISARFLADVETGKANISVVRLFQLARALRLPLTALLRPPATGVRQSIEALIDDHSDAELAVVLGLIEAALGLRRPPVVALIGIRGAGKSSVGVALAAELALPFIELTDHIEARTRLSIADIFTLHGEAYYRQQELLCFTALVRAGRPCVVALPGGLITSSAAMELLRGCTWVWLKASAEEYWRRVFDQGDTRPMSGRDDAMADLRALIASREPYYRQADIILDTTDTTTDLVASRLLAALDSASLRPDPNRTGE